MEGALVTRLKTIETLWAGRGWEWGWVGVGGLDVILSSGLSHVLSASLLSQTPCMSLHQSIPRALLCAHSHVSPALFLTGSQTLTMQIAKTP